MKVSNAMRYTVVGVLIFYPNEYIMLDILRSSERKRKIRAKMINRLLLHRGGFGGNIVFNFLRRNI